MILKTSNLKLIPCDTKILKAAIAGNDKLAAYLNINVPENWTEFGINAIEYALKKLSENEEESGWWTYFPVYKKDNILIGSGGYQGKPSENGTVEIGYEIIPAYRNQGLATEMAMGLIENAFRHERIKKVIAHTLGKVNPSTKVLKKCGFKFAEEILDAHEGMIWKWELKRHNAR